jgi:hypothetical protein
MAFPAFDKYSVNARLIPALIVLLPIGISLASLFPQKFLGWDLIVWLGTSSGLAVFLEQLARDKGRSKQSDLFALWGGDPAVSMLSHRSSKLNPVTLKRYHKKLSDLIDGIEIPSAEDELADPAKADDIYRSCISFLKSRTRDKEKFRMIFAENVNYGFRRNLWGMKPYALVFTILSVCLVLTQIFPHWQDIGDVPPVAWIALILDISFLAIWIFHIKPEWIRITSDAYITQLLSACDQL